MSHFDHVAKCVRTRQVYVIGNPFCHRLHIAGVTAGFINMAVAQLTEAVKRRCEYVYLMREMPPHTFEAICSDPTPVVAGGGVPNSNPVPHPAPLTHPLL